MLIRHLMSREILALDSATPCGEALARLRKERIRRAPVLARDTLVGMVSERDLLAVLPGSVAEFDSAHGRAALRRPVSSVMKSPVITVGPDEHLEAAAKLMLERKIGGIPVVDHGLLVGMLTESDILRAFVRLTWPGRGLRVTLEQPEHAVPTVQPYDAARRLELTVRALLTFGTYGGREQLILLVEGPRASELPALLAAAGWIVVELDGAGSRARA
jgi:acetoin utilization protein AcuB